MAPGRGRRKPLDVNARKVPFKAKAFLACSIAASTILVAYSYNRVALNKYEQTDLGVLLQAAPPLLACFVSWLMMWRDEIEINDGSLMGGFAVLAALGHVAMSLSVGLEWAGAALLAAAHGMLAARNAKGMRVAWLKKAIPHGRATEWMVGFGCAAGIQGVLSFQHISQGYGMVTACAVAAVYAMATLSMLTATFATYSERFSSVNSGEMFWAVAVLWAAEAARGVSLARAHSIQVTAGCGASVLFGTGVAMAGIAAYRRTILKSKNTL